MLLMLKQIFPVDEFLNELPGIFRNKWFLQQVTTNEWISNIYRATSLCSLFVCSIKKD